jgi:molecular chaperone GrpE
LPNAANARRKGEDMTENLLDRGKSVSTCLHPGACLPSKVNMLMRAACTARRARPLLVRSLPMPTSQPGLAQLSLRSCLLSRSLSTENSSTTGETKAEQEAEKTPEGEAEASPEANGGEESAEAGAEAAEELSAEEKLQARVEELEAEVASQKDQMLRALAEAENARRRAKIDVENAHKFAVGKFAKSLLDVADNLSRAAESVPEELRTSESEDQQVLRGLYDGVVMTENVLVKAFEANGMSKLWPMDEKFDPNFHNALFEMPDPSKEPGTVAHVASAGWVLHERCIRAAGVGIVSKPA